MDGGGHTLTGIAAILAALSTSRRRAHLRFSPSPLCNENNLNNRKNNFSLARGLSTFAKATVDESRPRPFVDP